MSSHCLFSGCSSEPKPRTKCKRYRCRWYSYCRAFFFPALFSHGRPCHGFFTRLVRSSRPPISSRLCARSFCAARIFSNTGRTSQFLSGCRSCSSFSALCDFGRRSADQHNAARPQSLRCRWNRGFGSIVFLHGREEPLIQKRCEDRDYGHHDERADAVKLVELRKVVKEKF